MRLLLDTNILIDLSSRQEFAGLSEPDLFEMVVGSNPFLVSVVSIWEIEIKTRLKKLSLSIKVDQLSDLVKIAGGVVLTVTQDHILTQLSTEPDTRDPFDRLLLTTAAAEDALLVTRDRALQAHPLVWKPSFPT